MSNERRWGKLGHNGSSRRYTGRCLRVGHCPLAEKENTDDGKQRERHENGEDYRPPHLRQRHRGRRVGAMRRAVRLFERAQAARVQSPLDAGGGRAALPHDFMPFNIANLPAWPNRCCHGVVLHPFQWPLPPLAHRAARFLSLGERQPDAAKGLRGEIRPHDRLRHLEIRGDLRHAHACGRFSCPCPRGLFVARHAASPFHRPKRTASPAPTITSRITTMSASIGVDMESCPFSECTDTFRTQYKPFVKTKEVCRMYPTGSRIVVSPFLGLGGARFARSIRWRPDEVQSRRRYGRTGGTSDV